MSDLWFLSRDAMHKRGLCRHAMCVCPSVHPSVCLSVTFVDQVKTNKHIFEIFSPSGSHTILVFFHTKRGGDILTGTLLTGGVECRWGIGRNRDSRQISGYRPMTGEVRTITATVDRAVYRTDISESCLSQPAWTITTKRREQNRIS